MPQDATAAARVAADGSTYVASSLRTAYWSVPLGGDVKRVLDNLVEVISLLYIQPIKIISNKFHG